MRNNSNCRSPMKKKKKSKLYIMVLQAQESPLRLSQQRKVRMWSAQRSIQTATTLLLSAHTNRQQKKYPSSLTLGASRSKTRMAMTSKKSVSSMSSSTRPSFRLMWEHGRNMQKRQDKVHKNSSSWLKKSIAVTVPKSLATCSNCSTVIPRGSRNIPSRPMQTWRSSSKSNSQAWT